MNYYLVEYMDQCCDYCDLHYGKTFILETPKEYKTKEMYMASLPTSHCFMTFKKVISDHRSALNFYFESVSESVFQKRYNFDKDYFDQDTFEEILKK